MGVNKKAKMTPIGFFISFLIIVVIGIVVINYTADIAEDIDTVVTTNSSNETILIESSTTLAPIGTTTTSSEVKANNQTYADFDGDGDYINFTSNNLDLFNKNEFTHIIFAKINNVNQDTQMILGTNSHLNYLNDAQGIIRLQNTGKLNILLNTTDDSSVQSSSGVLRNNTWEFIGGSYDNESYDLYLNSTRDVSLSVFGGNITGFYSSNYLSRANSGRYLNGSINSFKFYNRSLNSEMMAYSYNKEILGGNKGVGILEILYIYVFSKFGKIKKKETKELKKKKKK